MPKTTKPVEVDQFHVHEALHTANMMAEMVEAYLVNHPAVAQKPVLYRIARDAADLLCKLYQNTPNQYPES